jgi:hypothetical protein
LTEWWTYGLSDFLMFSPEAYWRLVARYNQAWWPAQGMGVLALCAATALLTRPRPWSTRLALLLLAGAWAWVAWAFHAQRHAEIFLGARWLALAGAAQALLLAGATLLPQRPVQAAVPLRGAGLVLLAVALLHPLLAPLTGRPWNQAEVFGWMPDPTAVATLGALLAMRTLQRWPRAVLALLPTLALLLGAATRWLLA